MSTRGPRGRFLALEPAQAGFKQLEIAVTNVFVAMFSGSLRVSPNVRMNRVMRPKMLLIGADSLPLGILAQASWRANRRKRPRVVTRGKIRCHSGLRARLPRRVRRPKRIAVILDRMPFRGSTQVCSLWSVIVVLGRVSLRDGPFVRLVRHVSGNIDRVKRLPWRDAHMVVLTLLTPNWSFASFLRLLFPLPVTKSSTEFAPDGRRPLERLSAAPACLATGENRGTAPHAAPE